MKFVKFPSIEGFTTIVKNIKEHAQYVGQDENNEAIFDRSVKMPVLKFKGTTKVHGTHGGVTHSFVDGVYAQKRSDVCTVDNDNAGFAVYVHSNKEFFTKLLLDLRKEFNVKEQDLLTIHGEWCGGNIQKGIAITGLPKMFIVFSLRSTTPVESEDENSQSTNLDSSNITASPENNFYNIRDFGEFEIEVDFENPILSQNKLMELTLAVEKECPVGKHFGKVLGQDKTTGEGIVWITEFKNSIYKMKIKGEEHSNSKVKTLKPVDDVKEQLKIDTAQKVTPAWRLAQMFSEANNTINDGIPDIKNIGPFLKLVNSDILKEELDVITSVGLEPKEIFGNVAKIAKSWYQEELNKAIMAL